MDKLSLLEKLALNNNLSKSEMNVTYYCYEQERSSKDVAMYLSWKAPNVARLLLTMFNKGLLSRRQLEDKKTYLYSTNISSELLDIKKISD
ncbi:hypothetical protein NC516_09120 [Latilactobacillus sakei]|uniref:hypothetical protein n=1 Tax=Latilactobacillus sakei TaxID=1599 RepID=UPI0020927323|nr:hypothetical protein [Latilactobacillus sakei]USS38529.1 hypothetical protein NC516_09120 [Latilactobacillus sakei]